MTPARLKSSPSLPAVLAQKARPALTSPVQADVVAVSSQLGDTGPSGSEHRSLWQKFVDYTCPREETGGNYEKASYFQALTQGGVEGFYLFGPAGVMTGAASSALSVAVQRKTTSRGWGVAVGAMSGAALAATTAAIVGGPVGLATAALGGGLLGALQAFRSDASGRMRDSAGGGIMLASFFMHGPAKMASGIASALGHQCDSKFAKAAIGAGVGLALGAALSLAGFATGGLALTALGTAAAGAIGPFFGPCFSQTFRNFAQDLGKFGAKVLDKIRPNNGDDKPEQRGASTPEALKKQRLASAVGAFPAAFAREFVRGGFMSDGQMMKTLIGSTIKAIQLSHMMYFATAHEAQDFRQSSDSVAML